MSYADVYHFPPELFQQLVDVLPLLTKSKKDLVLFFRGAGMTASMTFDIEEELATDRNAINKYDMTRRLLTRLNEAGDAALTIRRQLVRRVVEFEDFSRCYENNALQARGLVAEVQRVVNVKDSFTRMNLAREEAEQKVQAVYSAQREAEAQAKRQRHTRIAEAKAELFSLFQESDPHKRGKAVEVALNRLFAAYEILVAEDFRRKGMAGEGVLEQIDGVVEVDKELYLVEMKWWAGALGAEALAPHVSRLMMRAGVSGLYISSSDYTASALELADSVLQQRVLVLCTLQEIVALLEREGDLADFIRAKVRAAKLNRMAFKKILA
jgi:restriction endonuclease Mrr